MTAPRRFLMRLAVLAATVAACATPTQALQLEGRTLAERQPLGGATLELNGAGVRAVAWLKGYVAGLYLTRKCRTAAEAIAAPGPKRLQLHMLQDVGADEFAKAFDRGVRRHADEAELARLQTRVAAFDRLVRSIGQVRKGDVVDLDYLPATGTTMTLNGRPLGAPIAGGDFHGALLKVFVGDKVSDTALRAALLGG